MSDRATLCTFRLGGQWFGLEVTSVQEVLRHQPIATLRWAGESVRGLLNLRGQIVMAVDLRHALGLPPRPADLAPINVVVRAPGSGTAAMSLWVDEIGDVTEVEGEAFERAPATLRGQGQSLIRGVYKLNDRLLLALDLPRVMNAVAS